MLVILVAHYSEGSAFIEHYRMHRDPEEKTGRRFIGMGVRLRVIGQGEENTRLSVAAEIAAIGHTADITWLNYGVAGSAERHVGELVEVTASTSHRQSDPSIYLCHHNLAPASICMSVSEPVMDYPDSGVVDMEAYFLAAEIESQCILQKLTVIKLVVDGPDNPLQKLTPKELKRYLAEAQSKATEISDKLNLSETTSH